MGLNRFEQIAGPPVMQEEDALPDAPQRRGPEFARAGLTLTDAIRKSRAHVVQEQVGEQVDRTVL